VHAAGTPGPVLELASTRILARISSRPLRRPTDAQALTSRGDHAEMDNKIFTPKFIDFEHSAILHALVRHILDHADMVELPGRPVLSFDLT
jgi:hypothetical protein